MKFISKYLLLVLLVNLAGRVTSQSATLFHDVSEGLSQKTVTAITQDNHGFLWVGTHYGLNRFDGVDYKVYLNEESNSNSLGNNHINALEFDSIRNVLWIGTYGGGLDRFELDQDSITHFGKDLSNLNGDYITDLYLDGDHLWVATEKEGISVIDTKKNQRVDKVQSFNLNQIKKGYYTSIEKVDGKIVLGSWDRGFMIIDLDKGRLVLNSNITSPIRCLTKKGKSTIIAGSNAGLFSIYFDGEQITTEEIPIISGDNPVVLSLGYSERNKSLYVGTENKGLVVIDDKGSLDIHMSSYGPNTISGNSVWSIYEDQTGIIWLGFFYKGMAKIDARESKFFEISKFEADNQKVDLGMVNSLILTDNVLWIGTDGEGLYSWNSLTQEFRIHDIWQDNSQQVVTSLLETSGEEIWVGTWNEGIIIIDSKDGTVKDRILSEDGVSGRFIHSLHSNKKGEILVSSFGYSLDIYRGRKKILQYKENDLLSCKIRVVSSTCDNKILLGSEESGVQLLQLGNDGQIEKSRTYLDDLQKSNLYVNDIMVDSHCDAWFCTNGGLFKLQNSNDSLKEYSTTNGLPSNRVTSVLEDINGNIWGTTNMGIFKLIQETGEIQVFTKEDGLNSNEFIAESKFLSEGGEIYFGSNEGVNYFNPTVQNSNDFTSEPLITNIQIGSKPISNVSSTTKGQNYNGGRVNLNFKQNDISVEFAILNLTQASQNKYRIKLDGLDKEWVDWGNKRIAEYRNLQPGKYTFRVQGANNDNKWHADEASYTFNINNAWYNSTLAWLCYFLFFAAGTVFILYNIIARQKLRSELRLEHLENEKLKEISLIKSQFFTNISHEFNTPLTMIISPLKGFLSNPNKEMKTNEAEVILNNAQRLQKHIQQILDLAKIEAGQLNLNIAENDLTALISLIATDFEKLFRSKDLKLSTQLPVTRLTLHYDEYRMEQILSNLLSNAFKYSNEGTKVNILLEEGEDEVVLKVTDQGIGIAAEHIENIFNRYYRERDENKRGGTGLGLSITKQLTELHGGKIVVESTPGIGTSFTLKFPKQSVVEATSKSELLVSQNDISFQESSFIGNTITPNFDNDSRELNEQKPILLIAEDNADIRNFVKSYFEDNYKVITAKDGQEAYELSRQHIPDIIITDLMMPKKDGYELCKELKTDVLTSHIGIVMLTVKASEESQMKGLQYGADHYVTKPFNPELLKLRVTNILSYRDRQSKTEEKQLENVDAVTHLSEFDQKFLADLRMAILENVSDSNFGVNELCKSLGYSKSQLYRKLKGIKSVSANEFIRNTRLEAAVRLLQEGRLNISEITYKVGFNDLQYFRKCFKAMYGVPPSKFQVENLS